MELQTLAPMSVADYLAMERESEIKHEYVNGDLFEMPGVSYSHSRIGVNLTLLLGDRLDLDACQIHCANLRVKVSENQYYYPDLTVVCGVARLEDDEHMLLNPTLVVEITSPTSETRDRTVKLGDYKLIPSLEGILILDQDQVRADLHSREDDGWQLQLFDDLADVIPLPMLDCALPLAAIYRGVITEAQPD